MAAGGQWPYRIALVVVAAYLVIEGLWPVAIVYVLAWLLAERFLLPEVRRVQQERQDR